MVLSMVFGNNGRRAVTTVLLATTLTILGIGCGGKANLDIANPEKRFHEIKNLYDRKKFDKAIEEIEIFQVAFSGTAKVDSAQLLLAEAHFQLKEYLLAQSEYERLADQFSSSPLVEEARYKSALSWEKLSPKRTLDQKYTHNALDEYQAFLEEYPKSQYAKAAEEGHANCRERLALKDLDAANLYIKMQKYDAAILYFDQIVDSYYSTSAEPLAHLGKGIALTKLEDYSGAKAAFKLVLTKFPGSNAAIEAGKQLREVEIRENRNSGRNF